MYVARMQVLFFKDSRVSKSNRHTKSKRRTKTAKSVTNPRSKITHVFQPPIQRIHVTQSVHVPRLQVLFFSKHRVLERLHPRLVVGLSDGGPQKLSGGALRTQVIQALDLSCKVEIQGFTGQARKQCFSLTTGRVYHEIYPGALARREICWKPDLPAFKRHPLGKKGRATCVDSRKKALPRRCLKDRSGKPVTSFYQVPMKVCSAHQKFLTAPRCWQTSAASGSAPRSVWKTQKVTSAIVKREKWEAFSYRHVAVKMRRPALQCFRFFYVISQSGKRGDKERFDTGVYEQKRGQV